MRLNLAVSSVGALLLVSVVGLLYFRSIPKDITYEASLIETAYRRGDADALYDHVFEHERLAGLTAQRFHSVFKTLIRPRLRGWHERANTKVDRIGDGQASATNDWIDGEGHRIPVEFVANLTPDGGGVTLKDLLVPTWYAMYVKKTGESITEKTFALAIAEGLSHDAPQMRSIGLNGLASVDPERGVDSFDRMISGYRRRSLRTPPMPK